MLALYMCFNGTGIWGGETIYQINTILTQFCCCTCYIILKIILLSFEAGSHNKVHGQGQTKQKAGRS